MHPNTKILVERLISLDPEKRPTVMEVLTSELLPQEEIYEKLTKQLVNYRNPMKLKLMRFLTQLPTPKTLDVTYFGSYTYKNQGLSSLHRETTITAQPNEKQTYAKKQFISDSQLLHTTFVPKVEADLRQLFLQNGAREIANLPVLAPL